MIHRYVKKENERFLSQLLSFKNFKLIAQFSPLFLGSLHTLNNKAKLKVLFLMPKSTKATNESENKKKLNIKHLKHKSFFPIKVYIKDYL